MTARGALANDAKSGRKAIGQSRGGLTAKIHLAADLRCRPVARLTSPGQHGDSPYFVRRRLGNPAANTGDRMAEQCGDPSEIGGVRLSSPCLPSARTGHGDVQ
jgi:hypothetical protein